MAFYRALMPILPGTQLTISYVELAATRQERREELAGTYYFDISPCPALPRPPGVLPQAGDLGGPEAAAVSYCHHEQSVSSPLPPGYSKHLRPEPIAIIEFDLDPVEFGLKHSGSRIRVQNEASSVQKGSFQGILRVYRGLGEDEGEAPWPCDERDTELSRVVVQQLVSSSSAPASGSAGKSGVSALSGGVAVRSLASASSSYDSPLDMDDDGDVLSNCVEEDEDIGEDSMQEAAGSEAWNGDRYLPAAPFSSPEGSRVASGLRKETRKRGALRTVEVDCWGRWASEAISAARKVTGSPETKAPEGGRIIDDRLVGVLVGTSIQVDLSRFARRLAAAAFLQAEAQELGRAGNPKGAVDLLQRALGLVDSPPHPPAGARPPWGLVLWMQSDEYPSC